MTLSEVFYEAACGISEHHDAEWPSCWMIEQVLGGDYMPSQRVAYEAIMAPQSDCPWDTDVYRAAEVVGWSIRDYRTFMLLMAAEAVR